MVGRAIRIIELLALSESSPTLADLARSTGLPKSSLHRLLAVLTVHGVVARHGTTYRLGDRLGELIPSHGSRSASALRRRLVPELTDLHHRTGMIVGLATLAMPDVVLGEKVYGHQHRSAALLLPDRAPAHRTAAGRLLLALREPLHPNSASDSSAAEPANGRGELDAELARIREVGIALGHGEPASGMTTIACSVTGRDNRPAAALTLCVPDRHPEPARVIKFLREAAYAASVSVRCAVHGPARAADHRHVTNRPRSQPPPGRGSAALQGTSRPPLDRGTCATDDSVAG